jgi:hypothetical protein
VRMFARHRSATDPRTQIPPAGLLPYRPKRAQPYLYSDKEIEALLRAALKLPGNGGLRPWIYHCLLGLLSVSGLRLGAAQNLELRDVDLQAGVLTVGGAKFGKSRCSCMLRPAVLADYIARRERMWAGRPVSSTCSCRAGSPRADGYRARVARVLASFTVFGASQAGSPHRSRPWLVAATAATPPAALLAIAAASRTAMATADPATHHAVLRPRAIERCGRRAALLLPEERLSGLRRLG